MNKKGIFIVLLTCCIVYLIVLFFNVPRVKGSFQKVNFTDLEERPISFDQYKGKFVLVDLYGLWCIDCLRAIPSLIKLHDILQKEGWELVGISNDEVEKTKKFIETKGINYPCWHFKEDYKLLGVSNLPTYFVLNKEGKIIYKTSEKIDWSSPESLSLLRDLKENNE